MKKNFTAWNKTELWSLLGLDSTRDCHNLKTWVNSASEQLINDFEKEYLTWLLEQSIDFIDNWNEAELREQFIGVITRLVNFNSKELRFGVFAERRLNVIINDIELNGIVDWMVARGIDTPQQPFFFIHEYKKEEGSANTDSSGRSQLIATMRVAQELNENKDLPIFGCYVLGRFWFFTSLVGNYYCITKAYDATEMDELFEIVKILKAQKEIIIKRVTA